jgi:hypothetical protein
MIAAAEAYSDGMISQSELLSGFPANEPNHRISHINARSAARRAVSKLNWIPVALDQLEPKTRFDTETRQWSAESWQEGEHMEICVNLVCYEAGMAELLMAKGWDNIEKKPCEGLEPGLCTIDTNVESHAKLFREIVGNPFRIVTFDPAWRSTTAIGLAESMYTARDFAAMPILADALEEAGCDHPDVLAHCRGPGPHVRGCWLVDLVLGKS